MKKNKFTQAEIVHCLEQAKVGVPVPELLRKYGVSSATFYAWRKKYGGLSASDAGRLKLLEEENAKLKRVVADLALDKQILQDVLAKKL